MVTDSGADTPTGEVTLLTLFEKSGSNDGSDFAPARLVRLPRVVGRTGAVTSSVDAAPTGRSTTLHCMIGEKA